MIKAGLMLLVASTLALPGVASSKNPIVVTRHSDRPTAIVVVTPADFATSHARKLLDHRIGNAIESVCGSYATIESSQMPEMDDCWADARGQASSQIRLAQAGTEARITLAGR